VRLHHARPPGRRRSVLRLQPLAALRGLLPPDGRLLRKAEALGVKAPAAEPIEQVPEPAAPVRDLPLGLVSEATAGPPPPPATVTQPTPTHGPAVSSKRAATFLCAAEMNDRGSGTHAVDGNKNWTLIYAQNLGTRAGGEAVGSDF
jgi:hypothetical protein